MDRPGLLALAVGLAFVGCGGGPETARLNEHVSKLQRDTRALRASVAEAKAGTLARPDNVLIGVHEKAVLSLLEAALPIEHTFGAVRIRVERASVRFDGGLGTVHVYGSAWLEKHPKVAADVYTSGGFSEVQVDPARRLLVAPLRIDTLEARPMPGGLMAALLRGRLLRELNTFGRDEITRLLPPLEIPLKIEQEVHIPALDEDPLHIRGASLDVSVTFTRLFANDERLWLELKPEIGP